MKDVECVVVVCVFVVMIKCEDGFGWSDVVDVIVGEFVVLNCVIIGGEE